MLEEKNKHKRDKYVCMHEDYEENHIYLIHGKSHLDTGYRSVTTFLEQFFEDFDPKAVVDKYYKGWQEKKHKKYFELSKKDILKLWKANGLDARDKGTDMHLGFEQYVNDLAIEYLETKELINFMNWYDIEVSEPFRTEYTVYGSKEKIVGNIDFIYKNQKGETCIVDYKRSKVPSNFSFGKTCVGLDLPDTKVSKHMVQLNLYKYLLEKYYGLEIKHLYNLYIREDKCVFLERDIIDLKDILWTFVCRKSFEKCPIKKLSVFEL